MDRWITHNTPVTIVDDGWHNAFTDLAWWRGSLWCAFRRAPTHGIVPPGVIQIQTQDHPRDTQDPHPWYYHSTLALDNTDLRDPRFLATPQRLYCMLGAYHPRPGAQQLSNNSAENTIQTYVTSTKDGYTWTSLTPILRPGYWGWSSLILPRQRQDLVYVAAYHTGQSHTETSSIVLWGGTSFLTLMPIGTIYDGSSLQADGGPHYSPAEPVLFRTMTGDLGCCVRSEMTMDLGVGVPPYQAPQWRWRDTGSWIHPSATLATHQGTLLTGRLVPEPGRGRRDASPRVGLWRLTGDVPQLLGILPSYGDCAYAGLVAGVNPGTYHLSYYTQPPPTGTIEDTRGAAVQVVTVTLEDTL